MKRSISVLASLVVGLASPAFADGGEHEHAQHDIVETAVAAGSFKTLAAALKAADLVDALEADGPFTVFAPTDAAFAKLPKGTVEHLLRPENKHELVSILTYHVAQGRLNAHAAVRAKTAATLNGQRVAIAYDRTRHEVTVAGAKVSQPDIACSNGIIHVIDQVILPNDKDLLATAVEAGQFSTLAAAIAAADLTEVLQGEGPFTVFAPTDDAFAKLPAGTVEDLLEPENKDKLVSILKFHVVAGRVYSDQALAAAKATTLQGGELAITVSGGKATVNGAGLVTTDVDTTNGVIHVIDSVLLPGATTENSMRSCPAQGVIERAIQRGEQLIAHGQPAAAAAVYEQTAFSLVQLGGEWLPATVRSELNAATEKACGMGCDVSRSAALRRALDHVSQAISQAEQEAKPSQCPLQESSQPQGRTFY